MTGIQTFENKDIILTYYVIGNGPSPMLVFHGFGQNASVFSSWEEAIGHDYTIYSFNLFFHGSQWPYGETPLENDLMEDIFSQFLIKAGIDRFSLAAYSIGAKFALVLAQRFYLNIDRILLLAPDGIKLNFWYRVATGTSFSRSVFRFIVNNDGILMGILKLAGKLRIVHDTTFRFVNTQMANIEKRNKVFFTWVVFRKLFVNSALLAARLNEKNISVIVFIGDRDKIITANKIKPIIKLLNNTELISLPVDHHHLISGFYDWAKGRSGKL